MNVDTSSPPTNNTNAGGIASATSSVANLSQFDTSLVSKNAENAQTSPMKNDGNAHPSGVEQVGGGEGGDNQKKDAETVAEVPKTVPTSGPDDVEDDLTEATAATNVPPIRAPHSEDANSDEGRQQPMAVPKTSPYFASASNDNATSSPTAETGGIMDAAASNGNNGGGSPPREEIVIPGITGATTTAAAAGRHPSPNNAGGELASAMTTEPMDTSNPTTQPTANAAAGGAAVRSPHQGSVQRVSLSPPPPPPRRNANQGTSFSPKGNGGSGGGSNVNQNSIVIPGVPAGPCPYTANANAAAQNTTVVAQLEAGGTKNVNETTVGTTNPAGGFKANLQNGTRQKPSLLPNKSNVQQNAHPNNSRHGISKFGSGNAGGVKFAPETRTGANGQFGTAKKAAATNSTAITPDQRRRSNGNTAAASQVNTAVTPFARGGGGSNQNQNAVTPTPHKATATATAPAATTNAQQYDSTSDGRVFPGMTPAAEPKTMMEVEMMQPEVDEEEMVVDAPPPPQQRPRGQTITEYTSPPSSVTSPESSVTPKASNVNNNAMVVDAPVKGADGASTYHTTNNSTFLHTDESFDTLLEQFVRDIQDSTDIHERGSNDLLDLDVDLSKAWVSVLGYKNDYQDLLADIGGIQAMALEVVNEVHAE